MPRLPLALDEDALLEPGAGAHEGDQARTLTARRRSSADSIELERHGQSGGAGPGTAGDLGPRPYRREGGLDGICRARMDPMLGR
jgi:hypothetical protein